MTTPPDEFAKHFDAVELDPARAPSPQTIESALAACANDRPGFYLADDADGRFVVDREFGVVSLRDETLLADEFGAIHGVTLRVVQADGDSYLLDLKLRVTGIVPQMVGAEDFGFGGLADAPVDTAAPARTVPWTVFSPVRGREAHYAISTEGAYGALLAVQLPPTHERIVISFGEALPQPAPQNARWSI